MRKEKEGFLKNRKKFFSVCALLTAAGAALAAAGIAAGGMVNGVQLSAAGLSVSAPAFSKGGGQRIEEKKVLEPFYSIAVNMDYADIRIEPSDSNEYAISYCINKDMDFQYRMEGQKLLIETERQISMFTNNISFFSIKNNYLDGQKKDRVTLYIPNGTELETADLKSDCGDISCTGIKADSLHIETDYGNAKIQNVQAQKLNAALESGTLSMEQVKGRDCTADSSYGDIAMDSVSLNGSLHLQLDSGDIRWKDVSAKNLDLNSSYGNVTGEKLSFQNADVEMESGDCALAGIAFDSWDMESEYGDVKLTLADALEDYGYQLKTEYGRITIGGEDAGESYNSFFHKEEKGKTIKISCDSGNIKLDGK